jgi:hypothetical protein
VIPRLEERVRVFPVVLVPAVRKRALEPAAFGREQLTRSGIVHGGLLPER